jgi:hypothetical protein
MKKSKGSQILMAVRKSEPKKKRVTFFVAETTKDSLAIWCHEHEITESGAIEGMIRATVPLRYFKEEG